MRWSWAVAMAAVAACGAPDAEEAGAPAEPDPVEVDFVQEAVWSPRGDRLLASWHQGDMSRLYGIMLPDTAAEVVEPVTGLRVSDGPDMWASWSPDRMWIAFGSRRDGQGEIYRMRPDGMAPENLTDHPAEDGEPSYAPDGRRIAFVSDRSDGAPRLHVMNADGSDVRMVDNPPGLEHHGPTWSPDGTRIALYVTMEDEGDVLHVATPEGGWGRIVPGLFPSWAPDSDVLYYDRNDTIWSVRMSTTVRRRVHPGGFAPRVSPDGRWLAFVRGEWPRSSLFLLDLETGRERRLTGS